MPYNHFMEFIEATLFTRLVYTYLTDDEYLGLQGYLLQFPESGKVVPGSGGVRKLRWAMSGAGKRGGVRVIYYFKKQDDEMVKKLVKFIRRGLSVLFNYLYGGFKNESTVVFIGK
jgi:hypothetical protein